MTKEQVEILIAKTPTEELVSKLTFQNLSRVYKFIFGSNPSDDIFYKEDLVTVMKKKLQLMQDAI